MHPGLRVSLAMASGTNSWGVYNKDSSITIRRSTLSGDTAGLHVSGSTYSANVSQSTIIGGVDGSGTKTCVSSDNGAAVALGASCL